MKQITELNKNDEHPLSFFNCSSSSLISTVAHMDQGETESKGD